MTLSWLGLVQEIAGPLRHRLLPQCPPDGEYRDDLICRKDAHTSSSPAAQDAMGGSDWASPETTPQSPVWARARASGGRNQSPGAGAEWEWGGQASGSLAASCQGQSSGPILRSAASARQRAQPRRMRRTRASVSRASRQVLKPYAGGELVPRQRPEPGSRRGLGSRQGGKSPT